MTEQENEFLIEPEINQNHTTNRQQSNPSMSLAPRIFKMGLIFTASTFWLYYCSTLLPASKTSAESLTFPKNFQQLHALAVLLQTYTEDHWWSVFLLFSSAYIYKQAFAIPGSVFLNILAGALYGSVFGTIITSVYAAFGASCCYLLSKQIFGVLISKYFPAKLNSIKTFINEQQKIGSLFSVLLSLRFFPMSPNWLMNMSAPLVGVPMPIFSLSVGVGLIPYNFICAQAGNIISQITSTSDLFSWKILLTFATMAVVAGLPGFLKNRQKREN